MQGKSVDHRRTRAISAKISIASRKFPKSQLLGACADPSLAIASSGDPGAPEVSLSDNQAAARSGKFFEVQTRRNSAEFAEIFVEKSMSFGRVPKMHTVGTPSNLGDLFV